MKSEPAPPPRVGVLSNRHLHLLGSLVLAPQAAGLDPSTFQDLVQAGLVTRGLDTAERVVGWVTDAGFTAFARWLERAAFPEDNAGLTRRQADAYRVIVASLATSGVAPSLGELAKALGVCKSNAHRLITHLAAKGVVRHTPFRSRSMRLTSPTVEASA